MMSEIRWGRAASLAVVGIMLTLVQPLPFIQANNDNNDNSETPQRQQANPSDPRPDLKIEFTGFSNPPQRHTITFKVTNVGAARSTAIKARIETLSGGPTNLADPDVPSLAPGQSHTLFYGIGECNGHKVRAIVDDPLDLNTTNDREDVEVCAAASSAPANPNLDTSRIGTGPSAIPEHLRNGEHRLEIPPSVFRPYGLRRVNEGVDTCFTEEGPLGNVGFSYSESGFFQSCEVNSVYQLIVDFDLEWLQDIDQKLIYRAELRYDETGLESRYQNGNPMPTDTCVGRLGLAPLGYDAMINAQQLLDTADAGETRLNTGWLVTRDIQFSLVPGVRFQGFVLHGYDEDLDAENDAACYSTLRDVRLWLHYAIL